MISYSRNRNKGVGAVPFDNKSKNLFFKFHFLKKIFFTILLLIFLLFMHMVSRDLPLITKDNIIFSGLDLNRMDSMSSKGVLEEELVDSINLELNKNFWVINLDKIQSILKNNFWIKDVSLKKEWPNKLYINIQKHIPVALWNKDFLLTSAAKILPKEDHYLVNDLPALELRSNENGIDLNDNDQIIRSTVDWFNYFQRPLKKYGLNISSQIKESDGSFNLVIDDYLVLRLGNKNVKERYSRFLILLDQHLIDQLDDIERIDLRYMSGISVGYSSNEKRESILLTHANFN